MNYFYPSKKTILYINYGLLGGSSLKYNWFQNLKDEVLDIFHLDGS